MRIIVSAIFLVLVGCAGHKPLVDEYDESLALDFVDQASTLRFSGTDTFSIDFENMLMRMAELCDNGIHLPLYDNLDQLLRDADKAVSLDSTLIFFPFKNGDFLTAITGSEFLFRFLFGCQRRLEDFYQNEHQKGERTESVMSENGEFVYHFEQNVSQLLPILQAQSRYSAVRTDILFQLVTFYDMLDSSIEKKRFWRAMERTLSTLDLARSATGYEMFQRRADGLLKDPALLIEHLEDLENKEENVEIKSAARTIVRHAQKELQKPLTRDDKSLIATVELNKNFMREVRHDTVTSNRIQNERLQSWFERGYRSKDADLQIEYYTRAIQIDSLYAAAWNNRGNAYQAVGAYDNAKSDFDRAIQIEPDFELAFRNRGNLLVLQKNYDAALADMNRAIELDPQCARCYADRGPILIKLGDYESALKDLNHALSMDASPASTWNYRGICLEKLGRGEDALADFSMAIELDPRFAMAFINRGNLYRRKKNEEKAIKDYNVAVDLDPQSYLAFNNRAISYKNLGKYDEAIADHLRALTIKPDDAVAYYNLGCVYWEQKNWAAVIDSWQKCLALNPEHEYVKNWLPLAEKQIRKDR